MAAELSVDKILSIISKAWGRQSGWCFFPTISGTAKDQRERNMSYEEHQAFKWPTDRAKIAAHIEANRDNDIYWCPSLFEEPRRKDVFAKDSRCLWADLDAADPRKIKDYPPTIAWETSPGRYQCLWVLASGYIMGAAWAGKENQRMTYHVGADKAGWDITQLMRLPTFKNYKPEYREKYGEAPRGKLLWNGGDDHRTYQPRDFDDLPEVPGGGGPESDILEEEVEHVDRHAVLARVRLKVSKRVREFLKA
jgi:hypothetical protein